MRRFNTRLLAVFALASAASVAAIHLLEDGDALPFVQEPFEARYIVSISLYNALALSGALVARRYLVSDGGFYQGLSALAAVFIVAVVARQPLFDDWPTLSQVAVSVTWELARAIGVAFAVAYLAHSVYSRYFPTTILRARDITPVLGRGEPATAPRRRHAKNAQWLFDMRDREYLDTTRLRLRTRRLPSPDWVAWGEATMWSGILILSFGIYIEVYPRVADAFGVVLTSVMAAHLLSLIPLLLLPSYPVDRLGAEVPVEGSAYELSQGFRHTAFRWTKLSFIPIIVIAVLIRYVKWDDIPQLVDLLLICVPTAALINHVYLTCFCDRTVARIQEAIPRWEERERELWGEEPWREESLMEGVEPLGDGEGPS